MKPKMSVCKNCRFYIEHFIKRGYCLFPIEGHCINDNIRRTYSYTGFHLRETCEYWEPMQIQVERRKQTVFAVLKSMQTRLTEIALILKDDADRGIKSP